MDARYKWDLVNVRTKRHRLFDRATLKVILSILPVGGKWRCIRPFSQPFSAMHHFPHMSLEEAKAQAVIYARLKGWM